MQTALYCLMNNTKPTRHVPEFSLGYKLRFTADWRFTVELSTSGISNLTVTDELFKTFWHYFQNILVMLVETISSRTMELVLLDEEMDIFNCWNRFNFV